MDGVSHYLPQRSLLTWACTRTLVTEMSSSHVLVWPGVLGFSKIFSLRCSEPRSSHQLERAKELFKVVQATK